jgi:hypothetical protein
MNTIGRPYRVFQIALFVAFAFTSQASFGQILISQYYENSDDDRVIEFVNVGINAIDFSTSDLFLGSWIDANTESYKSATMPDGFAAFDTFFSGLTMASGEVLVLNISPGPVSQIFPFAFQGSLSSLNADGNDSIAIYEFDAGTYTVTDAIGFTNNGFEGRDTSWERIAIDPGFDVAAGSNVTTYAPSVWLEHSTAEVDAATSGGIAIGISSLPIAVPEPSSMCLLLAMGTGAALRRRKR